MKLLYTLFAWGQNFGCFLLLFLFLPARASEQGNVIGSVRIREYGSTLYLGLARAVSPTNTVFSECTEAITTSLTNFPEI